MKRKVLSIMLVAAMTVSTLVGCGGNTASTENTTTTTTATETTETAEVVAPTGDAFADLPDTIKGNVIKATPEMYADTDLSKPYTVNMYLIGDTPNDWDAALAEMNSILEPFNTTLAVTFMSWSDYQTMYSLNLAGGADIDIIFTAPWCYMYTEAAKGSFYELSTDFVSKYMPLTAKYQAEESWDETTLAGKTIAVPSNAAQPMGKIVAVRQDLMEKYGMTELKNWEDYKQYMLTIAEKETPESGIYAMASAGDNNELWDVYRQQTDTFLALDSNYTDFIYEYKGELPKKTGL